MSSTSIALMVVAEWASQELGEGAEDGWYNKKGFREDLYKCEQIEFIRLRARLPYPLTDFKDGQNYNRKKELQGRIDCVGFEGLKALARWDEGHHEEHQWEVEHRVSCSVLKKIIAKKRFTLTECKALICIWNTANINLFAAGSMTNKALANFTSMAVDGKLDFDDPEVATYNLSEEDGVRPRILANCRRVLQGRQSAAGATKWCNKFANIHTVRKIGVLICDTTIRQLHRWSINRSNI